MNPTDSLPSPEARHQSSSGYQYYSGYQAGSSLDESLTGAVQGYSKLVARSARDHLLWLVLFGLGVSGIAFTYLISQSPVHQSVASVRILRTPGRVNQFEDATNQNIVSAEDVNTQLNILNSIAILQLVDEQLKGDMRKAFLDPYFQVGTTAANDAPTVPQILFKNRKATPRRLTLIFDISYNHPNPTVAAAVANLFAESYLAYNEGKVAETTVKGIDSLTLQIQNQKSKIKELELKIAEFKARYDTTSFEKTQDIKMQQLQVLSQEVTKSNQELFRSQGIREQIETARKKGEDLWRISAVAANPAVQSALNRVSELEVQLSALSQRYLRRHPKVVEYQESLDKANRQLAEASARSAEAILSDIERLSREHDRLVEEESRKRQEYIKLDLVRPEYDALVRDLDINRQHYDYYYNRGQQLSVKVGDEQRIGQIIDRALPSTEPFSPRITTVVPLSLGLGIVSTGLLVLIIPFFDNRVRFASDLEVSCKTDVLGVVPEFALKASQRIDTSFILDPANRALEVFSGLLAMLRLVEGDRPVTRLLVTSSEPAEGKTALATSLATALAVEGKRTLLVEADLRLPKLRRVFPPNGELRDINYWVQDPHLQLGSFIVRDPASGLDVLAFDRAVDNPLSLLASNRYTTAMRELFSQYDRVVIDTPPVRMVPDAMTLMPLADGALFVTRYGKSKLQQVNAAIRRLRTSGRLLGAVVNGVSPQAGRKYYAEHYRREENYYYQQETSQPEPQDKAV